MKSLKVEITSRETIKPSSPTPFSLRTFKLSLLDQLSPLEYVPMILFYETHGDSEAKAMQRSDRLKQSLSETLTQFYPLSGRIKDGINIECNDEGVEFLEAKVNCSLAEILRKPETEALNQILPHGYHCTDSPMQVQLAIQLNIFSCGGIAIGICILHKIVDGYTLTSFVNAWATMARGTCKKSMSPTYIGASLFLPRDLSGHLPSIEVPKANCITKRFVFEDSKMDSLRAKAAGSSCKDRATATRVQAVSALIWKCAMDVCIARSGSLRPSVVTHTVNLSPRTDPPLPENSAGNLLWLAVAPAAMSTEGRQMELDALVSRIRNAIMKFDADYVREMQGEDGFSVICESLKQIGELFSKDMDIYSFTSLCKFPLYEADFGWGKPVWISSAGLVFKNVIILMDTRLGNGIEAWVTLDEQDMAIFERNQELLASVSSNPSASILFLNSHL